MLKNTASQKWYVFAFNTTTGVVVTGDAANITANVRIDGGAANAVDDTNPTELELGYYAFDITAAESNGDYIVITPSSVTSDIQVIGVPGAFTTELAVPSVNVTEVGGSAQDIATGTILNQVSGKTDVLLGGLILQQTTITGLVSQTVFDLTAGSADDDAYNGRIAVVIDASTLTQKAVAEILDYDGTGKTLTLAADPGIFTMANGDSITIVSLNVAAGAGGAPTAVQNRQEMDSNSTKLIAIVADTNELQGDWVNAGRLDAILDAVKVDTAAVLVDTGTTLDGRIPAALVGGKMDANVGAVSGDTTAADNMELMFDGTGYTDETAPASRQQVDNIGASSGAALSYETSEDNTAGAIIDAVTIIGSITANLFTDTDVENGTRHQLTHSGNAFDFVYGTPIGGGRTAATVEWRGYLTSSNDACSMQVFDHVGSAWDTIATISGTNGTVNGSHIANLLSKHTGTGAELGKVYIRFVCTGQTSPVLNTDLLLVQAVNIGQSVGYANGGIWIDTVNGVAGTEAFVNGVADKPTNLIASAKTLSTSVGIGDFHVINGSTITLAESTANESYFGDNWTLALAGQTVTGAYFQGAIVSGVAVGAAEFFKCFVGTTTMIDDSHFDSCSMTGTMTLPVGTVFIDNCHHGGSFVLDFGAAVGSTTVHLHNFAGNVELQNIGDLGTDIVHLDGHGTLTINANSSGGTVHLRGNWKIADSAGGAVTITYDDPTANTAAILVDTGTTLDGRIPAALAGGLMKVDVLAVSGDTTAADNLEAAHDGDGYIGGTILQDVNVKQISGSATAADNLEEACKTMVLFACEGTPTTTVIQTNLAEATDDHYIGRIIIFRDAALKWQATDITDYAGATGTLTVTALTEAPSSGDLGMIL